MLFARANIHRGRFVHQESSCTPCSRHDKARRLWRSALSIWILVEDAALSTAAKTFGVAAATRRLEGQLLLVYSDLLSEGLLLFATFFGAVVTALLAGIAFHEFSHAFTASQLGDNTARAMGRVSLNPVRHLDPAGTVFMFIAGFGWGKPVPVNPYRLRNGPEKGRAMVAAAGPLSNLLLATLASLPLHLGLVDWRSPFLVPASVSSWGVNDYAGLFLGSIIIFNVLLAVFNLLPLAPLDGFSVAVGLLPRDLSRSVAQLEQYGPAILLVLIALPFLTNGNVSILHEVMSPAINFLTDLIAGGGRALN